MLLSGRVPAGVWVMVPAKVWARAKDKARE